MRFGLAGLQAGRGCEPDGLAEVARLAESLGFESLWAAEHVIIPDRVTSRYPFNAEGKLHNDPTASRPNPLIWLAFAAAATSRIRLGTCILLLPLRNPVLLAKETATLDRLSGGRLILGVGIGWMREEFDVLGSDWSDRGRRAEEYIGVLRALWQPGPRSFSGTTVSFEDVHCIPTPVHQQIPIVVSGTSEVAARRAGRLGDGYFPMGVTPERLHELLGIARTEAERSGRSPDRIEVTYLGAPNSVEIDAADGAGVDRYIVMDRTVDFTREPERLIALAETLGLPRPGRPLSPRQSLLAEPPRPKRARARTGCGRWRVRPQQLLQDRRRMTGHGGSLGFMAPSCATDGTRRPFSCTQHVERIKLVTGQWHRANGPDRACDFNVYVDFMDSQV